MANLKLGVTIGGNVAIHSGNYNNYTPTLTGGNASGTWGISISGNSATTSQTNFSALSVNNNAVWHAGNFSPSSYLPLSGGTLTGKVFGPSMDAGVYGGLIEIRERGYVNATQDAWDYSPALTFHWGNRHAKRFGMRSDGQFAVDNAPLATQAWVASQGYVTSDSDFQTLSWQPDSLTLTISGGNAVELTGLATQDWVNGQGYITGYSETDTLATVTSRGASTSSNLSLNGRVTFASSATNRPQFPGGMLGLDTGDGNFDIWGISRDYYPTHPTGANQWGLEWYGDGNQFRFVGGGTRRITLDMDDGNIYTTGTVTSDGAMYAPIYYDANDTYYYVNPAGVSLLSSARIIGGELRFQNGTYYNGLGTWGARMYSQDDGNGVPVYMDVQWVGNWRNALKIASGNDDNNPSLRTYFTTQLATDGGHVAIGGTSRNYSNSDNTPVLGAMRDVILTVNGSIQLVGNTDGIIFGRGAASFLRDEELGFGWGGGWYMEDETWVRVRNNKNIYTTGIIRSDGDMRAPIFYDQNDTNYYVDPNSDSRLHIVRPNGITDPGYTRIVNPDGGRYVTQTSVVTGALRIKLPTQGSAMMMTCTVKVYEYSVNKSFTITFGGHRDSANWYNEFCYLDGDNNRGELTVRFGVDGGKDCVYIGETGTQWSYPQVFVTDVQLGYAGYNANWVTGWEVGFVTSFATVNRTQTAYRKLTPANYNSYAPSLTGSGASGTWGINVTGTAGSETLGTVTGRGATTSATITAERYRGNNSLALNNYTTVNPSSNVFLYSQPNDRDAWLFLDSADTGSNWGIYHRQIDSTVGDLPANSLGFVGGGSSVLQAYISLANGNAYFRGSTTTSTDFRAPVFYDSNTTYYFDGNSTTSLRTLGSWRSDSADWDGEFAGKIQYHANSWYLQAQERWYFRNEGGENVLTCTNDGNLTINGALTENSSLRYKENIKSVGSVLESVETLRAVTYNKIGQDQTEFGLIAEEVAEVYPEIVNYDEDGRPDGINYTRLSAILLKAVQELSEKIKKLES